MRVTIGDGLWVDLDGEGLPVDLRSLSPTVLDQLIRETAAVAIAALAAGGDESAAMLHALAVAVSHRVEAFQATTIDALAAALRRDRVRAVSFELGLTELDENMAFDVFTRLLERFPDLVSRVFEAALYMTESMKRTIMLRIFNDPREEVRLNGLKQLNRGHQLNPPGSLQWKESDVPAELLEHLTRELIHDPSPDVRCSAIALALGLGKSELIRDDLLSLAGDPQIKVRQYALIAMGILSDRESLDLLRTRLESGSDPEIASSTWGLARRPEGISSVIEKLPGAAEWFVSNVLEAIMFFSAPLSDQQIAALRQAVMHPQLDETIRHHLWRTRSPEGRETPLDGQVWHVRRHNDGERS